MRKTVSALLDTQLTCIPVKVWGRPMRLCWRRFQKRRYGQVLASIFVQEIVFSDTVAVAIGGLLRSVSQVCSSMYRASGNKASLLPPIGDDLGVYNIEKEPKNGHWHPDKWPEPERRTREILIKDYGIPEWFFKNVGWNANGFYGTSVRPSKSPHWGYGESVLHGVWLLL